MRIEMGDINIRDFERKDAKLRDIDRSGRVLQIFDSAIIKDLRYNRFRTGDTVQNRFAALIDMVVPLQHEINV